MRLLALIGALAIVVGAAAGVYFLGGFYSVAASNADPASVAWALGRVRVASIDRHATDQPPAATNDQNAIRQGARRFAEVGCVNCHGAPGAQWAKFAEGLNPEAADLGEIAKQRSVAQIFWVLKNGIRMTGMPSFGKAGVPDDQLWQIAAFVKAMPTVSEGDYKAWSAAPQ